MNTNHPILSLRNLLRLDAMTCAVFGVVLVAGAGWLEQLTHIPSALLFYAGIVLFPVAAFMALTAGRAAIPTPAAGLVVLGNALWVVGSFLLLLTGWIDPNAIGAGFIVLQAVVVAVLAALESRAIRTVAQSVP